MFYQNKVEYDGIVICLHKDITIRSISTFVSSKILASFSTFPTMTIKFIKVHLHKVKKDAILICYFPL